MQEIEDVLRRELEAVNARLRRLDQDMLLAEGVPTDGQRFSKAATNLLVVQTRRPQMPYLVLVDEDLHYGGADPFLVSVFSNGERSNGWRPLLLAPGHLMQTSPVAVARAALRFLGFPISAVTALPAGLCADWGFREAHPPLVGRAEIVTRAEAVLGQQTERAAVVLVGPSGVGKTALTRELAWRWQEQDGGRSAVRVDLPAVLVGATSSSDRAERLQHLYAEALRLGPSALLVLEDLHLACGGGLARLALCRALESGLHLCATTTWSDLVALRDEALRRRLFFIEVPEPSEEELRSRILPTVARYLETRYGVNVTTEALVMAVPVSAGQLGAQPGKAIRVLDGGLAKARQRKVTVLGPDDILESEP